MKQLKKRTLALVLASVVTVVGSFAAENYKNCLMALAFKTDDNGSVQMLLETEKAYSQQINPIKKDANTYIITLPDVNSADSVPIIGDLPNVSSVNVRTMPYSNNGNGYTRVTIKTTGSPSFQTYTRIYVPSKINKTLISGYAKASDKANNTSNVKTKPIKVQEEITQENEVNVEQETKTSAKKAESSKAPISTNVTENDINDNNFFDEPEENSDPTEKILLVLGILLIIAVAIYSYIKAKDKLVQLAGEQIVLDLEEDDVKNKKKFNAKQEKKKSSNSGRIRNAIKNLDTKYPKSATMVRQETFDTKPLPKVQEVKAVEPVEEVNVVDLDELFKEQVKSQQTVAEESKEEEENAALEDFLSGFSFDEDLLEQELKEENDGYDLELYNSTIADNSLRFSEKDIECINKIINTEIQDSTLRDIEQFAVSNPIKRSPSKKEVLEEIASTYAISQNIIFTSEDMNALFKLISVEIDRDFIEDLRTNPERTKEMYREIKSGTSKKPSEILTLSVKDMLPNLSEALKKEGAVSKESARKTEVVYCSEGYDVAKLKISSELPNLTDALAHPEKYQAPPQEEFVPDEEVLLKNISNVIFKPFDDGTRSFETVNDIEEMSSGEQDSYIDLDSQNFKQDNLQQELSAVKQEETAAKSLLEQIRKRREERSATDNVVNENIKQTEILAEPVMASDSSTDNVQCLVDGEAFKVLDSINFTATSGCHLVKNSNGYAVMGFVGDKLSKVKTLENVKTEKIQARMSETLADGSCHYIVKIGYIKFIVNADNNYVEYVMDL